jgi:5-formyltetrahydrofolate cyclo-ligase
MHPLQILDEDLPMTEHDIPLSAIVTPDEVMEIGSSFSRPRGIYWNRLEPDKIDAIPILRMAAKKR